MFRTNLFRVRPPTLLLSLIFCLLGLPDGRRRTPRTPHQVLPLHPARALSSGGRSRVWWEPFPPARSTALAGSRGPGAFSTSHECSLSGTPTLYPCPFQPIIFFSFSCCPGGRGTASPGTRPTSPRSGTQLLWFPRPCFSSCGNCPPGRPLLFTSRSPFLCLQIDVFSALMYRLPSCAERVPPTWLAPGLDQGPSLLLPRGTSFGRSVQPRPPYFRRGRRTDLSAWRRVPPIPEVPGRASPPTPLNSYTFTLFRRHPCRHGRPSIRLQTIHMHYLRLVLFPMHNNSSSIQHLCDECRAEPPELQLRSPRSSSVMSWIHTSSPVWYSRL